MPDFKLQEPARQHLDTIVHEMTTNGEHPDTIMNVVNDFKSKYGVDHSGAQAFANQKGPSPSFMQNLQGASNDISVGMAKGAGNTLNNLGKAGGLALNQTVGRVTNAMTGKGFTANPTGSINQSVFNTNNKDQRVGFGAENVAEYMIPGAGMEDAAAKGSSQLAAKFGLGEMGQGISKFLGRSAEQGVENAAITAAQTGNGKQSRDAGLLGTLGPVLGKVTELGSKVLDRAMATGAQQLVDTAFGRTFGERKEALFASLKGLPTFASKYLQEGKWFATAGSAMHTIENKILPQAGKALQKISDSPVGMRKIVTKDLEPALNDGLKKLEQEMGKFNPQFQKIKEAIGSDFNLLTWKDGQKLKQAIYELMPRNAFKTVDGQPTKLSFIADQLRDVAHKLNDRLAKGAKDTQYSKLNFTYGLFKEAQKSLVEKSSRGFSLFEKTAGAAQGVAPFLSHGIAAALPAAAVAAERAATSVPGALGAAFGINNIRKEAGAIANSPIGKRVGGALRKGFLGSIGR
jgi:hypothetical protein